ncbi:MAG: hypothetical protein ABSH11_01920 [Verrucomicrobiota bacterium]|jgi:hypothetical protein
MRTIKFIAGLGCFVAALRPLSLTLFAFSSLGGAEKLQMFCGASIMAVLTIGLIWAGCFLIARRGLPLSQKAKVLITLPFMGIMVVVALPNFIKARSTSASNACVNNLRQIDAAANEFALEHGKTNGGAINYPDDLTPYIKLNSQGKIPPCPQGGIYSIKKVGDAPTCSLATNGFPWHALP